MITVNIKVNTVDLLIFNNQHTVNEEEKTKSDKNTNLDKSICSEACTMNQYQHALDLFWLPRQQLRSRITCVTTLVNN